MGFRSGRRKKTADPVVADEVPAPVPEQVDPLRSEGYEPVFPRTGTHRRVLGHITPEVDRDHEGPRNTLPALTAGLIRDDHTEIWYPEQVQPFLTALVEAGLASETDGVYEVTEAGWRELMN